MTKNFLTNTTTIIIIIIMQKSGECIVNRSSLFSGPLANCKQSCINLFSVQGQLVAGRLHSFFGLSWDSPYLLEGFDKVIATLRLTFSHMAQTYGSNLGGRWWGQQTL